MRQPLVTIMRMASALIQCVTRTMRGCISTQRDGTGSISALMCIAYTLQRSPSVSLAEAREGRREAASERDHLEELTHLGGVHQAVGLIREREKRRPVFRRRAREHLGDPAVGEELRLARVSEQVEPAFAGGRGDRAEVDVGRDVLQAGKKKRIGVRLMPVMAHERSFTALRVVVLPLRE